MKKILFFLDTARLGRQWNTDVRSCALSGTDSVTIETARLCFRAGMDVALVVTSKPSRVAEADIKITTVASFERACAHAGEIGDCYLVFAIGKHDNELSILRAAQHSGAGFIGWAHNSPTFEWLNNASELTNLHAIVSVSNGQSANFSHHPLYKKSVVIPNFVDVEEWSPVEGQSEERSVTFVGALCHSKGFHYLAQVWPGIYHDHPDWRLIVCGSAGLYSDKSALGPFGLAEVEYERLILGPFGGNLAAAENMGVRFLGSVPREQLKGQIGRSSVVVVNPRWNGSVETFCMSAAESMSMQRPVLGGKGGALPEVVGNSSGGLLSASEDELATNLQMLIDDSDLRRRLGKNGRERIMHRYSGDLSLAQWRRLANGEKVARYPYKDRSAFPATYWLRRVLRNTVPLRVLELIRSVRHRVS